MTGDKRKLCFKIYIKMSWLGLRENVECRALTSIHLCQQIGYMGTEEPLCTGDLMVPWAVSSRKYPKLLLPHCTISINTIIAVVPGMYLLTPGHGRAPSSHGRTQNPMGNYRCFAFRGWCLAGKRGDRQDHVAALQTSHLL